MPLPLCTVTKEYLRICLCYCYAACFAPLLIIDFVLGQRYSSGRGDAPNGLQ